MFDNEDAGSSKHGSMHCPFWDEVIHSGIYIKKQ